MRIHEVIKSITRPDMRKIISIIAVVTLLSSISSISVHATQTPLIDGSIIDVSGSAHGDQIIAGVKYGSAPASGGGADSECEWSESMPRDASATGPGHVVTKQIGSTSYRLFDYTCPARDPSTTYHWLPQMSPGRLAEHAASIVYDNLPAMWGQLCTTRNARICRCGDMDLGQPLVMDSRCSHSIHRHSGRHYFGYH